MIPGHSDPPTALFGVSTGIVTRSFFEGLFAALRDAGWQVVYATTDERGARSLAEAEGALFVTVPVRRDPTPWQDAAALLAVVRLLRRHRPDICVWGTPKMGLLGSVSSRLCGIRGVYVVHGLRYQTARGWRRRGLRLAETVTCWAADIVVPVGRDVARTLVDDGITSAARIEVLGHGSANGVQVPAPVTRVALDVDVPSADVVVGFVGRLTRDKGLLELLAAWEQLVHDVAGCSLVLAGAPEPDAEQGPLADALAVSPRTHLVGHLEDLAPLYSRIDVLVLPSHREGLPTVVLEAATYGIPCITTSATGAAEPVLPDVTGLVVPVASTPALLRALRRMVTDGDLRARMGLAARQHVTERWARDDVHRRWLTFLQRQVDGAEAWDCPAPGAAEGRFWHGPPMVPGG